MIIHDPWMIRGFTWISFWPKTYIILFLYRRMKIGNLININMHLTAHHSWESLNLCWRKWLLDLKNTSHLMEEWQTIFQRDTMGLPWCTETKELTWALCITNARQICQFHTRWLATWCSHNKTTKIFLSQAWSWNKFK